MKKEIFAILAAATVIGVAGTARSEEASAMICLNPSASLLWKTIPGANPSVQLDWPLGAVRATVFVDSTVAAELTDTTKKSCTIPLSLPASRAEEKVLRFEIAYFDEAGAELSRQEAKLGYVLGCAGDDITFIASSESRRWQTLKSDSAVFMLPKGSDLLTVDGEEAETMASPGWHELDGITATGNALALTTGETAFNAWIRRAADGLILIGR